MNKYVDRVREDDRGFTLIELMIVIVILGILAGIVIFAVGGITDRGNVAACKTDLKTIEVAVEAYYAKNKSTWPADLDPTLTNSDGSSPDNVFLRPDLPDLSGNTKVGEGYTVTYDPATGEVTADLC